MPTKDRLGASLRYLLTASMFEGYSTGLEGFMFNELDAQIDLQPRRFCHAYLNTDLWATLSSEWDTICADL